MPHTRRRSPSRFRRTTKTHRCSPINLIRSFDKYFHKKEKNSFSVSSRIITAIRALPQCPLQKVHLNTLYPQGPDKMFGVGRSGAYVFRIQTDKGPILLKYYADAYSNHPGTDKKQSYSTKNPRPFREVLCLKALSGIQGFPVVHATHCARLPMSWLQQFGVSTEDHIKRFGNLCGLTITMSLAHGVSLAELDVPVKSGERTQFGRGLCCRILYLLDRAKQELGYSFRHNDLHPGNIIVDMSKSVTTTLKWTDSQHQTQSCTFQSPDVTIIDFDLANISNSAFQNAIAIRDSSNLSWIQSIMTNTVRAWKPADQMSFYFVSKHRKTTEINSLLKHTSNLKLHNVDLRNLMVIMSVFSS